MHCLTHTQHCNTMAISSSSSAGNLKPIDVALMGTVGDSHFSSVAPS